MINEKELRTRITKNLIYYRKKAGLTQMDVARILSYSDKAISKWERGLGLPDITILVQLADFYHVSISDIVEIDHDDDQIYKEIDEDNKELIHKKHLLISYISVGLLWLLSIVLFFIFKVIFQDPSLRFYLIIIYTFPLTFVVALIFNIIWGNAKYNASYESLFVWLLACSIIITIYPKLDSPNIFYILLITFAVQVLIVLWNNYLNTGRIFKNWFDRRSIIKQKRRDKRKQKKNK